MTPEERDLLIERVAGSHRARDPFDALKAEPAFYDLDEAGRREAYARAVTTRLLEAALDANGLSSTGHAVLARVTRP
ncbi:MAG TPA: hypothetical protein VFU02_18400 [Polyangiaceae bacterium]|nr:hypothetical protein [Polyangiaceae bacterium]